MSTRADEAVCRVRSLIWGCSYTFDATQTKLCGNRAAIANGQDTADVALATQFGSLALIEMKVSVQTYEPFDG
ncbi:MAG: hypothetical protein ACFBSF_04620 [Leptolyngbyaceae cyanobacterium]